MKVLFLPVNVASIPSISAESINKKEGMESICISQHLHHYHASSSLVKHLPLHSIRRNPFLWFIDQFTYKRKIKKWIQWADVIHYVWGPVFKNGEDLKWAKMYDKPIFIEFVGSELRNPDIVKLINPFYKKAWGEGYEYKGIESKENSFSVQKMFSEYGAVPIVCPEMSLYLISELYTRQYCLFQRMNVKDFVPTYPPINKEKILIVHAPTAPVAKGSKYIIDVVESLQKDFDFDFKLLHNMPRKDVLEWMTKSDIFVDQVVLGAYGIATIEAMSFGKPVVCYLMPQLFEKGLPDDCPVVNANKDSLKEQLICLIENAKLRHDIGIRSRIYAEKYHDADVIAEQLIEIYQEALAKKEENAQ